MCKVVYQSHKTPKMKGVFFQTITYQFLTSGFQTHVAIFIYICDVPRENNDINDER